MLVALPPKRVSSASPSESFGIAKVMEEYECLGARALVRSGRDTPTPSVGTVPKRSLDNALV